MKETAARICRDYLYGVWKHITAQNIILKRIRFVKVSCTVHVPDVYYNLIMETR